MMLGFVGGSGTRGHGEKVSDMEMAKARRDGRKNVTASSSASEFDEDDEVERKRAEKGKGKAIEAEDAKETQSKDTNEQKEHEWLVLDMCDDNGTFMSRRCARSEGIRLCLSVRFFTHESLRARISPVILFVSLANCLLISLLTTSYIQLSLQFCAFFTVTPNARPLLHFSPSLRL